MTAHCQWTALDEPALARLAALVALKARPGDLILLRGELGAGKTAFARAFVRAMLADAEAEVPSPTFPLVIGYETPRAEVAHFDLYRLTDAVEAEEIGLEEASRRGIALVEWPERAETHLAGSRLDIRLEPGPGPETRRVTALAGPGWSERLARLAEIGRFLDGACAGAGGGWNDLRYLQGDASPRAYARLRCSGAPRVLMDSPRMADGPPIRGGLPYSRIAHLAEDVTAFHALAAALTTRGLRVPAVRAFDHAAGLLLVDDLGTTTFADALRAGIGQDRLWSAALDVLIALRGRGPLAAELPIPGTGLSHQLHVFDEPALAIEVELLTDWLWPLMRDEPAPDVVKAEFQAHWQRLFARIGREPLGLVLRDFHSPNLMWIEGAGGAGEVGVLDFQDAMRGSWAYDVASLLQDARVDVPAVLERDLLEHYLAVMRQREPGFDSEAFRRDYAILAAQRNTKILGIFARLKVRDGKPQYLAHLPRIWGYLERSLAHPELAGIAGWYDRHFPVHTRRAVG